MLDPASLIGPPGTAWSDGAARILAFSFAADGLSAVDAPLSRGDWSAFTDVQRGSARAALAEFSAAAGLVFVEVPDSQAGMLADLRLRLEVFDPWWVAGRARPAPHGEVALSQTFSQNDSLAPGRRGFETLLHEIGHALGLVHPEDSGVAFPTDANHRGITVMALAPGPDGVARDLRALDQAALRLLYGAPEDRDFAWTWEGDRIAISGGGTLRGTAWHDILRGGPGDDSLFGGTGDDVLIGGGGADLLSGGPGFDVARFASAGRGTPISLSADPLGGMRGAVGAATLEGIEALVFLDGRLAFDAADPVAQAARLLSAAGIVAGPVRLGEVAAALAAGADPVAILIALDVGAASAAAAAAQAFAPGAGAGQILPPGGLWAEDPAAALVARLYVAALHRLPEEGGLAFWLGVGDPLEIARGILASPEHQAVLDSGDPVTLFYLGALARLPEPEGLAFWQARLAADPGHVLLGIAASEEARLLADVRDDWPFA